METFGEQPVQRWSPPARAVLAMFAAATMERTASVIMGYESPITDVIEVATAIVAYRRLGNDYIDLSQQSRNEALQQR